MTKRLKPYLFIAPAGLCMVFVFIYPVIRIIQLSMQKTISGVPTFVGFRNFQYLFNDPVFAQSLSNNAKLLLAVPVLVFGCLLFAMLLFERVRGWEIFRTALFIPFLLSIVVVGTVFSYIYTLHGALNEVLETLHLGFLAQDWLGSKKIVILSIISVIVYREMGFGIVLYLARLMSINEELFEAAMIDGANWWQRVRYIAIPQLRETMEFYAVILVIMVFSSVFDYVFVMTRGGPGTSSWVSEFYIYSMSIRYQNNGVAAAMACVLLVISLVLIILRLRVSKGTEEYA
jgi:ABC-type sugar transport system permease subunit